MVHSPFIDISASEKSELLSLARHSISYFISQRKTLAIDLNNYSERLRQQAASFVTLHSKAKLRGCIGSTTAYQPLAVDVVHHAQAAAFEDPRFPPVTADEHEEITISVSVLTHPEPLNVDDIQQLVDQLEPGVDGLIIKDGFHQATFLPSVWQQLPEPRNFLQHLIRKAGLPVNYAGDNLQAWIYQTIEFSEGEELSKEHSEEK